MTCETIAPLLDDYLDGTLPPETAAGVESHIATCAACQHEVAARRSILTEAQSLPRSIMPQQDLWTGIEARLGGNTAQRLGGSAAPRQRRAALPRMSLLAAAAIALVVGGAALATFFQRTPTPISNAFAAAQSRYQRETAELARQVSQNPDALPEATRAVVERNLAIVDAAIRDAEDALQSDQANTALEQMILARYEQRLALLKRATEAGRREL